MSEPLNVEDQLVLDAAIFIEARLRDQIPSILHPKDAALVAAIALETAGMLRQPPAVLHQPCGHCGHNGDLHGTSCCRGEGPPAYGSCKCGRWVPRRLQVVEA